MLLWKTSYKRFVNFICSVICENICNTLHFCPSLKSTRVHSMEFMSNEFNSKYNLSRAPVLDKESFQPWWSFWNLQEYGYYSRQLFVTSPAKLWKSPPFSKSNKSFTRMYNADPSEAYRKHDLTDDGRTTKRFTPNIHDGSWNTLFQTSAQASWYKKCSTWRDSPWPKSV